MATRRKEIVMTRDQTDQLIDLFEQEEDLLTIPSKEHEMPQTVDVF